MQRQNIPSGSPWEGVIGFSRAVRLGNQVFVSGTTAIGPDRKTVGIGDAYVQTKRCFEIIKEALEKTNAKFENVVRTRVFLTRIEDWEKIAQAHGEVFGNIRPASTFVQVTAFVNPDALVEIEADAVLE